MTLFSGGKIIGAVVLERAVGVPFDIGNVGILCHQVVNDLKDKVLHLGVTHIQEYLGASASLLQVVTFLLQHPVGMLFVEFRDGVGAFGLNPDAEVNAQTFGFVDKCLDATGQFLAVNHPVAERTPVIVALIFLTEPPVVHHEQFTTHLLNVFHHLEHAFFIHVENNTFPGVEQDFTRLVALMEPSLMACPAVEIAADTA